MSEEIHCPKCGSYQISANKKGFSGKKAVAGALLTGGVGVLAGTIGSNDVEITCLACGEHWEPKEYGAKVAQYKAQNKAVAYNQWKGAFKDAYDAGNFSKAKEIYATNADMLGRYPDFHAGYKHIKRGEITMGIIVFLVFVSIVAFLMWVII